jgi:hypothetical protein
MKAQLKKQYENKNFTCCDDGLDDHSSVPMGKAKEGEAGVLPAYSISLQQR